MSPGASVPPSSRSDWPLWLWPPRGKVFLVSGRERRRNGQGPAEATGCPPALIRDRERRPEGRGAVRLWPPPLAGLGNPIPEPPGLAAPPALLVTVRGAEPQGC